MVQAKTKSEPLPKEFLLRLGQGGELLRAERFAEARQELERAIALCPGEPRARSLLGFACFSLGQLDEAAAIYRELVAQNPADAAARLNLGLVYLKGEQLEPAIAELEAVRAQEPENQKAFGYLGLAYARVGDYVRARDAFVAAGQPELGRQMDEALAGGQGLDPIGGAPAAPPPLPVTNAPLATAAARDRTGSVGGMAARGAVEAPASGVSSTPILDAVGAASYRGAVEAPASGVSSAPILDAVGAASYRGAVEAPASGVSSTPILDAVGAASYRGAVEALASGVSSTPILREVVPLSRFAEQCRVLLEDGGPAITLADKGVLVARIAQERPLFVRGSGIVAMSGAIAFEPAQRRVRGQRTAEPLGGTDAPLYLAHGDGSIVALAGGDAELQAIGLVQDTLYVSEDVLFAFESSLRYENGRMPGQDRTFMMAQLRGDGAAVLRLARRPIAVPVSIDRPIYVDATRLVAWAGRLVPRLLAKAPPDGGGGDGDGAGGGGLLEVTGDGVVFLGAPWAERTAGAPAPGPEPATGAEPPADEPPAAEPPADESGGAALDSF